MEGKGEGKHSKWGLFEHGGPGRSSGRRGHSEPDLRKHLAKSTDKDKKPSRNRCSCCRKHYSLMDSLKRVNPPKYCYYCREEVCKRCHRNDSCHRCFTRERSDVRSVSRLEEMERPEIMRILRELHCPPAVLALDRSQDLVLALLTHCRMDSHFVRQYKEHLSQKDTDRTIKTEENLEPDVSKDEAEVVIERGPSPTTDTSCSSVNTDSAETDFRSAFLERLASASDEQLRALSAVFALMKPA